LSKCGGRWDSGWILFQYLAVTLFSEDRLQLAQHETVAEILHILPVNMRDRIKLTACDLRRPTRYA
jgi:hypothetical protein